VGLDVLRADSRRVVKAADLVRAHGLLGDDVSGASQIRRPPSLVVPPLAPVLSRLVSSDLRTSDGGGLRRPAFLWWDQTREGSCVVASDYRHNALGALAVATGRGSQAESS